MAFGKDKKKREPRVAYNPYYGKAKDESHMAEKPFFTWKLANPGLLQGSLVGMKIRDVFLGGVFGAIIGIALGSLLDKAIEKRRKKREER